MGKKYIIELEDNESVYKTIIANGYPMIQVIVPAPYTEPDFEQVRKEAYETGAKSSAVVIADDKAHEAYKLGYENGLNDAWEAARKIAKLDTDEQKRLFGCFGIYFVAHEYSASECIEKIRQYEQRQEEQIQVGDEVIATSGKAVIVGINADKDKARYIYPDSTLGFDNICNLSKTGRHFPEIAEVLQKMKES